MSKQIIKLEQFEGPMSLLLKLIENEELKITEVSLAHVTDQYITTLEEQTNLHPDEIADFLVVASRLLLIKSRVLLPDYSTIEDTADESELERQLKMYREFVDASKNINVNWKSTKEFFTRQKPLKVAKIKFLPPKNIVVNDFYEIINKIVLELEPIVKIKTKKMDLTVSIKDKIGLIKELIQNQVKIDFQSLLKRHESKAEKIVSFLAVLEMVKQREVNVQQEAMFTSITINKS